MAFRTVSRPLEWFRDNEANYRGHPPAQLEHLQRSLRDFGVVKNVVAREDGTVLCGHGVVAAARAEGLKTLPTLIFTGDEGLARKLLVADNELARLAEDDEGRLATLLGEIRNTDCLLGTGWDEESLEALLGAGGAGESGEDAALSGDRETVANQWLVAVVVDEATHAALLARLGQARQPGEDLKATLRREFAAMVGRA